MGIIKDYITRRVNRRAHILRIALLVPYRLDTVMKACKQVDDSVLPLLVADLAHGEPTYRTTVFAAQCVMEEARHAVARKH